MSCKQCSKIRCKLFGLVRGVKTKFVEEYGCGSLGTACIFNKYTTVLDRFGDYAQSNRADFGNSFSNSGTYIKALGLALRDRIAGR